nr:uncharacterized protein LOC112707739 isoform X2 [Arachis hypogaea]
MAIKIQAQGREAEMISISWSEIEKYSSGHAYSNSSYSGVRITEDASLYALCRSWLRNGVHEENQPQQNDVMRALPKPLPASAVTGYTSNKKEEKDNDEHEEKEESVEHLSAPDILKRHIKSAKKVRARLREERLHRISRYRSRLQLLIPPQVEHLKNDTAAGN